MSRRLRLLVVGVVTILLTVAAIMALFPGPFPAGLATLLAGRLPTPSASVGVLLLVGVLLACGLYVWSGPRRGDQNDALVDDEQPPEAPRNAPRLIDEPFATETAEAIRDIRIAEVDEARTTPRQLLRDTVARTVQLSRGYDEDAAGRVIDNGGWTDDPIAAAFIGDDVEYPLRFQLFRWAQPTAAYERAIDRTTRAIDRSVTVSFPERRPGTPSRDSGSTWFERVSDARVNDTGSDHIRADGGEIP